MDVVQILVNFMFVFVISKGKYGEKFFLFKEVSKIENVVVNNVLNESVFVLQIDFCFFKNVVVFKDLVIDSILRFLKEIFVKYFMSVGELFVKNVVIKENLEKGDVKLVKIGSEREMCL